MFSSRFVMLLEFLKIGDESCQGVPQLELFGTCLSVSHHVDFIPNHLKHAGRVPHQRQTGLSWGKCRSEVKPKKQITKERAASWDDGFSITTSATAFVNSL
jgi:hypothetical protein